MTRPDAQDSRAARVLVFVGLALWLTSLLLHEAWVIGVAAAFTVLGAAVYLSRLRSGNDTRS
jgi:Flp pilus assembly protein TadB